MGVNYNQLIQTRDEKVRTIGRFPIGELHRQLMDGKYSNVLRIRKDMQSDVVFSSDLVTEQKSMTENPSLYRVKASAVVQENDIVALKLEQGKLCSIADLLENNPAAVAQRGFVSGIISSVSSILNDLHNEGKLQLCLAPESLLVRQNTTKVLIATHGSNYLNISNQRELYKGFEDYVAPEVLNGKTVDERSDVYAFGKLIEHLYKTLNVSAEVKRVIERSTAEDPSERYESIDAMCSDLKKRKFLRRTLVIVGAAAGLALVIVGGMASIFEKPAEVEYVTPAPKMSTDDLLERGIDPIMEMGLIANDTIGEETPEQAAERAEHQKKAEEIFRRRYRQAAIRLLGKVYDKTNMSQPQNDFVSANQKALEELARLQLEYGNDAGLEDAKSQEIAGQLIEEISNSLK